MGLGAGSGLTPRWVGIVAVVLGGVAILIPAVASVTIALFIGWIFLFAGVLTLGGAVAHAGPHRLMRALWGVVFLIAGFYLEVAPLRGTITLTFVLVVNFLIVGGLRIGAWWANRDTPGAAAVGLNGAMSVFIALLILVDFPSSSGWAIGLLVGVDLLLFGITVLTASPASGSPTAQPGVG